MIRKLHHNAYRCRDSQHTRRFYDTPMNPATNGARSRLQRWTQSKLGSPRAQGPHDTTLPAQGGAGEHP